MDAYLSSPNRTACVIGACKILLFNQLNKNSYSLQVVTNCRSNDHYPCTRPNPILIRTSKLNNGARSTMEDTNYYRALPREIEMVTTDINEDNLIPIANVGRIMKQVIPPNSKVSKIAKETMQECASEFIGFVTGEAADRCKKEKRKMINGDDICHAFEALGLDHYAVAMKRYMERYRECKNHTISVLKVNASAQLDSPRAELSLFRDCLCEDDQICSNVATTTKFL